MAVHAVAETFLDTQSHGVDLAVLGAELRIERPSRPHRRRTSLAAMVQMAVGAIQAIADIVACILLRIGKDRLAASDRLAEWPGRYRAFRRRYKWRCRRPRCDQGGHNQSPQLHPHHPLPGAHQKAPLLR